MPPLRYRTLNPYDLEAAVAGDLERAMQKRGATVRHIGGAGNPDIVVDCGAFVLVVEVASRTGASAAAEYLAIREHRDHTEREFGKPTHLLFSCWASPPRLTKAMQEENSAREGRGEPGRSLFLDLLSLERVLQRLGETSRDLYPNDRWAQWFARWAEIGDDVVALELLQGTVFTEDQPLEEFVHELVEKRTQAKQEKLRKDIRRLEDLLRHRNVTRDEAMRVLVYIVFVKLYEEKREARGGTNRFTVETFPQYRNSLSARSRAEYEGRTLQHLIEAEIALDDDVRQANLLEGVRMPVQINDGFVEGEVLPRLDDYRFRGTHVDALGAVFEALARRAEKDTRIGQFFTPDPIARFAVDVSRPGAAETVLDPAAGTGRFLVYSMERMRQHASTVTGVPLATVLQSIETRQILGTDADQWIVTIAKMNMYVHGDGKSNIIRENGLFLSDIQVFPTRPGVLHGQVDVCLTNPPLGDMDYQAYAADIAARAQYAGAADEWLAERLPLLPGEFLEERVSRDAEQKIRLWSERYRKAIADEDAREERTANRYLSYHQRRLAEASATLAAKNGTYRVSGNTAKGGALFLAAIKDYLKPVQDAAAPEERRGGRTCIIVDEAIMNTPEYAETRRFIRENFFVKAVFSFYRDAFWYQARTTAKTSLLYLYRKPDPSVGQREPVFYCHVEKIGFTRTGKPDESQLPQILASYREFENALRESYRGDHFDHADALQRVRGLALPTAARVRWSPHEVEHAGARMDYAYEVARQIRATLPQDHRSLGDLVTVEHRPANENPLGLYTFATIDRNTGEVRTRGERTTEYRPEDLLVVEENDLVLSGIDFVHGSVGFAGPEVHGQVVSKEFYILRLRPEHEDEVDPRFLALFLRTPRIRDLVAGTITGTSNRTRVEDEAALLSLPLPSLPGIEAQREVADHVEEALGLRREARRLLHRGLREADAVWAVDPGGDA